ncbi:hypothetical protein CEXT_716551 [Caerostris extrusa]|uniref:Uncharacterized protein n=1 Tax=Caerostris extrusa TaxID=172846 RepID=A0AAV4VZK8_CAEEX|nr:hypothetical protein CEXT_716551 [Caerostris extrusa]
MEMIREIVYFFFKPTPENADPEKFTHLLYKRRCFGVAIVIRFGLVSLCAAALEQASSSFIEAMLLPDKQKGISIGLYF